MKLSPHTEVWPPAPEVSAVFVHFTFYYWTQNEPLFSWSNNWLPSKFSHGLKFDRVSSGFLTLPDVGADLCLVLFYKKTYSRISNWSITQTLLYQNSRHPVQNHNPPLHSFITPLHFPLPSHTFSISLPYTFCCPSWHYVLASYLDWYQF